MKVLFLHQNFPGQFRHLAQHLARLPGCEVVALALPEAPGLPGIRTFRYRPHRSPAKETHPYLRGFENAVLHGQGVHRALAPLQRQGFVPDVVVAHPGWGEALFVKEVFPRCRVVNFCEYYYRRHGADVGFDPEFPPSPDAGARLLVRNALHLTNLENCDAAIAPTPWQKHLHPAAYADRIRVVHEGIDTERVLPDASASLVLPNGRFLRAGDPVVTYVARNLEPYRGFPTFMRSLPHVLDQHQSCDVIVVGGDNVSYGSNPRDARNWREKMLGEVDIDSRRVHFLGRVPNETYRRVLQVSAAHVYLTYPFVLSWSMLEAMSAGCMVIASDTAPVRDALVHGANGWLVDFFKPESLAEKVLEALEGGDEVRRLRAQARATALSSFGLAQGVEGYLSTIEQVTGRRPDAVPN